MVVTLLLPPARDIVAAASPTGPPARAPHSLDELHALLVVLVVPLAGVLAAPAHGGSQCVVKQPPHVSYVVLRLRPLLLQVAMTAC